MTVLQDILERAKHLPPPLQAPRGTNINPFVRGALLGAAIGDGLGNTTESRNPPDRALRHGRTTHYLPNKYANYAAVGVPTDDTQLTAWTLEHLLQYGRLDPDLLSTTFANRQIFGVGRATRAFQIARRSGMAWDEAGQPSAGNGALMRAPGLLPLHAANPTPQLWHDAAVFAAISHMDRLAISSAVAWTAILQRLIARERLTGPEWWCDRYIEVARVLEGDAHLATRIAYGPFHGWTGPSWNFVDGPVRDAIRSGKSVLDAQAEWHSGAFLLETIPTVLLICAHHGESVRDAIECAVNDSRDNDTIAAIVGAAMGAQHGEEALPESWRSDLTGRTGADDDGRYQELVGAVVARFSQPSN